MTALIERLQEYTESEVFVQSKYAKPSSLAGYSQGRLGLWDTIYSVYVLRGFAIHVLEASQMAFVGVSPVKAK